jgi:predicted dehydrogenase
MKTNKIKVGIIGAGIVARDMHLPVLANMTNVDISWICDIDEKRAEQLARTHQIGCVFSSVQQCPDVNIALVAIPVGHRRKLMPQVLNRKWNLLCEKPFAITLDDHDTYLDLAKQQNVQIGVGLLRRYGSATAVAKQLIGKRVFGDVLRVWGNEGSRTKRTGMDSGWYMNQPSAAGGGVLAETGSHLLDQLSYVLNARAFRLDACTQRKYASLDLETIGSGTLSMNQQPRSIPCCFHISRIHDLCNGIYVQFSNVILRCGLFFEDPLDVYSSDGNFLFRIDASAGANNIMQAVYFEWSEFIEQCLTGKPAVISAETTRISTGIIEQCYKDAVVQ